MSRKRPKTSTIKDSITGVFLGVPVKLCWVTYFLNTPEQLLPFLYIRYKTLGAHLHSIYGIFQKFLVKRPAFSQSSRRPVFLLTDRFHQRCFPTFYNWYSVNTSKQVVLCEENLLTFLLLQEISILVTGGIAPRNKLSYTDWLHYSSILERQTWGKNGDGKISLLQIVVIRIFEQPPRSINSKLVFVDGIF